MPSSIARYSRLRRSSRLAIPTLQRGTTILEGLILGPLALDQRVEDTSQAVACEQMLLFDVVDDKPVELCHRHMPSPKMIENERRCRYETM